MPSLQLIEEEIRQKYEQERETREFWEAYRGPEMRYQIVWDRHGAIEDAYTTTLKEAVAVASAGRHKCACGKIHGYAIFDETGEQVG